MQRDAYASLIKFPKTRKIPTRIMQMNGRVFHENLMRFFFKGYEARRLTLMTHMAGQDPALPRLPHDIIVPTFDAFLKIHQPHFMYKLVPLLTADVETFAAMQAVCTSPGSPFALQDRIDTSILNFRLSNLCAQRDRICEFFKDDTEASELLMPTSTRRLPLLSVGFQGILLREKIRLAAADAPEVPGSAPRPATGAALLTTHPVCNEAVIHKRALMTRFFRSSLYMDSVGGTPLSRLIHSAPHQWHVMAIKRRVGGGGNTSAEQRMRAHLVQAARQEDLLLYEKVDEGVYQYVH